MVDRHDEFSLYQGIIERIDKNETNQAGAGDAITSKSLGTLKTLDLQYQSAYGHQTWQNGHLPS